MYRSQLNNLKRRIEALEKLPALQPLPEPHDCGSMIQLMAAMQLDLAQLRVLRPVIAAQEEGVQRALDRQESEAWDTLRAALELETRRAAFTEFAEYERAYFALCLGRIPVASTGGVELQIASQVADYRWSHGKPSLPEGWKLPKSWLRRARGIWAAKCKSLLCGRTPGG